MVYAWGINSYGQLGDGTTTPRDRPTQVHLPCDIDIVDIAAGAAHGLALTSDGQVYAWGRNDRGQLGNGTTDESRSPVLVTLPPDTTITQISTRTEHNLALTDTGQVLAWGANGSGQLGDGTTTDRSTPVPVSRPPDTTATLIAAGAGTGHAVTSTGQLLGWGSNSVGAVGEPGWRPRYPVRGIVARRDPAFAVGAIRRIAGQFGVHPEASRTWVKKAETDAGDRPGTTSSDAERPRRVGTGSA